MFDSLEQNALQRIQTARQLVQANFQLATTLSGDSVGIREFTLAATVGRLYGVYESFVHQIISDYLDILSENRLYKDLTDEFKNEYRIGVSFILGRIDHRRYGHLNVENIISWYSDCLNHKAPYKFIAEALARHEENLRLPSLVTLFRRVQLPNIDAWLADCTPMSNLFSGGACSIEVISNELKNFVELRNDVSHGSIDNLESEENLLRICDFIQGLLVGIAAFVRRFALTEVLSTRQVMEAGLVTEVFRGPGAFIVKLNAMSELRRGNKIYFLNSIDCVSTTIKSLKYYDSDVNRILAKVNDLELGVTSSFLPSKKMRVFYMVSESSNNI